MKIKQDIYINNDIAHSNFSRLINQIYKLLPMIEENLDWQKPLETLLEELYGLFRVVEEIPPQFLLLICKLEGLFVLTEQKDFSLYRRTIFECLGLMEEVSKSVIS